MGSCTMPQLLRLSVLWLVKLSADTETAMSATEAGALLAAFVAAKADAVVVDAVVSVVAVTMAGGRAAAM